VSLRWYVGLRASSRLLLFRVFVMFALPRAVADEFQRGCPVMMLQGLLSSSFHIHNRSEACDPRFEIGGLMPPMGGDVT